MTERNHLEIQDNQSDKSLSDCGLKVQSENINEDLEKKVSEDLEKIANVKLKENPNLLIFPQSLGYHGDGIGELEICSFKNGKLSTGNLMGFVGCGSVELSIYSRFANDVSGDYFLHYMLQKVFCHNLFDLNHSYDKNSIFDFLLYVFPRFLNKALAQGVFKEYQRFEHNDSRVKGAIDVGRHIRYNIPFAGRIAYNTREYACDNRITQLIRHTVEYIKSHKFGQNVLSAQETRNNVRIIVDSTPSYKRNDLQKILNANLREVHHPYFSEYTVLQKICLQILRHDGLKYGDDNREVYGILFDGAWLWEEYLNTILCKKFIHPKNKEGKNSIWLFENSTFKRYPDFYKRASCENVNDAIILDAKYKSLDNNIDRDDVHQIISYMHVERAGLGGLIYPSCGNGVIVRIGTLRGFGGKVKKYGFPIPQNVSGMQDFVKNMQKRECKIDNKFHLSK